jgi:hypothetical protein
MSSTFAVVGSRGVEEGSPVRTSITVDQHRPLGQWSGHVCYNDNHVALERTMSPASARLDTGAADNLFAEDATRQDSSGAPIGGSGGDIWLTLSTAISPEEELELTWD